MKRKVILYLLSNILIVVPLSVLTYIVMKYPIKLLVFASIAYIPGSMMATASIYKMFGDRYGKRYKYMLGTGILLTGCIFTLYLSASMVVSEMVRNVSNMICIILFLSCIFLMVKLFKYHDKK